jgi:GDP-D-mannose 3', 5'-epimerase
MTGCALVCGAGGFIGGHLVRRLKREGLSVRGVDLKFREFSDTEADDFVSGDLRDQSTCRAIVDRRFDKVYQLAADTGGAGYSFTGEHDAELMHNSATINLNMLDACRKRDISKIFPDYAPSSAGSDVVQIMNGDDLVEARDGSQRGPIPKRSQRARFRAAIRH